MARLRSRFLTCFYCGRRSDTRFDGVTRQFTCKYCDATNHLDEAGEITDPPTATEHVAATNPLAASFSQSDLATTTTSHRSTSIFCATCLKNQRLFVASLAQYIPGGDNDDVTLDREYYRFRRGLEKRYPQVCAKCEAAAGDAIQRAEYTAKTDHLRKMMEMSRKQVHSAYKRRTPLDWVHILAQAVWWSALVLQMLWHLKLVAWILGQSNSGMSDPDDESIWARGVRELQRGVTYLPGEDALIRASLTASFASAWWNPKFVQVSRGFTKQLSGFKQFYMFQMLLCGSRYFFGELDMEEQPRNAQLSAHAVMAAMAIFVSLLASSCIKTDTTPLFAPHNGTVSPKRGQQPARRKKDEMKTLAETLDEALPQTDSPAAERNSHLTSADSTYSYQFTPKQVPVKTYDSVDEMEWTPTAPSSLPRALKDSPSSPDRKFGQAPTHEGGGPFYYRTPAAPINPARKLRNPPNQPALWKTAEKENSVSSFNGLGGMGISQPTQPRGPTEKPKSGLQLSKPKFFAPREESADDENLASLLGKGFSLDDEKPVDKKGWFGW